MAVPVVPAGPVPMESMVVQGQSRARRALSASRALTADQAGQVVGVA